MTSAVAILFANLRGNLGDLAILQAMLRDLSIRFPERRLHVYPHGFHAVDDSRFSAFRAACDIDFELMDATPFWRADPRAPLGLLRAIGVWPFLQARMVRSLAGRFAAQAERFRDYEAIAVAGGDYGGGSRTYISVHGILTAIHEVNDAIYAFPFSLNRGIRKSNFKRDLRASYQRIHQPRIARDGDTQAILDKLGIESLLGIDCVFSLRDRADEIPPAEARDKSRVVLVLTAKDLKSDLGAALQKISSIGSPVELMTTCECVDGEYCEAVAREFGVPYLAPTTWQEAVAELKACSLLVTNRLHGLIFGSLAGIPLLPVADRAKSAAFAKDAQMPFVAPRISSLNGALVEQCLTERDAILKRVGQYGNRLRKTSYSPLWTE